MKFHRRWVITTRFILSETAPKIEMVLKDYLSDADENICCSGDTFWTVLHCPRCDVRRCKGNRITLLPALQVSCSNVLMVRTRKIRKYTDSDDGVSVSSIHTARQLQYDYIMTLLDLSRFNYSYFISRFRSFPDESQYQIQKRIINILLR